MNNLEKNTETFPSNWLTLRLKDLVLYTIGGDWGLLPVKNSKDYVEVKVIRGTDFKEWERTRSKGASVRMIQLSSLLKRRLNHGNVVVEISGGSIDQPVGRAVIIDDLALNDTYPLVCSNFFRKIQLSSSVSPFFLNYFFQYSYKRGDYNKIQTETTNLRNLSFIDFLEQEVPFPTYEEQLEIVDKLNDLLDKLSSAREVVEKIPLMIKSIKKKVLSAAFNGDLTKEFRSTNLHRLKLLVSKKTTLDLSKVEVSDRTLLPAIPVSWEYGLIAEFENFVGSGITPKGKNKYANTGIPFFRSQNIYPGGLVTEDLVFISQEQHDKMSRTKLFPNDVLLNITGASIGRSTFLPANFKEGNVNQHVCIIRFPEQILPEIVSLYLNSDTGQKLIFSTQTGVTREGLNYSQVKGLWIPLIPIEEQTEIVRRVNSLFSKIDSVEGKFESIKEKINSISFRLLNDAFTGELTESNSEMQNLKELHEKVEIERKKYNQTISTASKKIASLSMKSNRQVSLQDVLKNQFNESSFFFEDIQEYFQLDYETTKEEFFDLIKNHIIKTEYDSIIKTYRFTINVT